MLRVCSLAPSRLLGALFSLSLLVVASSPAFARLRPQGPPSAGTSSATYTVQSPGGATASVRYTLTDNHVVAFTISRAGQPDHTFTGDLDRPLATLRVGSREVARVVGASETSDAQLVTAAGAFTARQLKDVPSLYTGGPTGAARDAFVGDFDVIWAVLRFNPHVGYFQTPYSIASGDWNYDRLIANGAGGQANRSGDSQPVGYTFGGCTNNCKLWFSSCSYDCNSCMRGCEAQYQNQRDSAYWAACPSSGGSGGAY